MRPSSTIAKVEVIPAASWCFVRLTTESGVVGIGESTAFAYPLAVAEVVRTIEPWLVGQDARDTERNWLMMYRSLGWRGIAIGAAISAIDQALWDIRSRIFEVPVWEMLGGRARSGVRAMRVIQPGTTEAMIESSQKAMSDGYSAIKVILHAPEHHRMGHAKRVKSLVSRLGDIRDAVGDDLDIGVELHRNMQPANSTVLINETAQFRPLFVEDPIPPDSVLSLGEVAQKVAVPLAAGERNTSMWEFREYIEQAGIAFVRPDIGIAGGFTHVRKICALAEAHHQGVVPHAVPSGPVATMAHVHLGIAVPNWEVQEHAEDDYAPASKAVLEELPLKDGMLLPRDEPGLGLTLNDSWLETQPVKVWPIKTELRTDNSVAVR